MSTLETFSNLLNGDADPFRNHPEDLRELQLEGVRERFAQRRAQVRMLDKRATDMGVDQIRSEADLVPLVFAHQIYKSYPESFLEAGKWAHLNVWMQTLTSRPIVDANMDDIRDVDDYMGRLAAVGHHIFSSSGTSGKCSFISQTEGDMRNVATGFAKYLLACNEGFKRDSGKRRMFAMIPTESANRYVGPVIETLSNLGADHTLMLTEPAATEDLIRMGRMRRAIADGTARPSEIAEFERDAAERQARVGGMIEVFLDKLLECRDEPVCILGSASMHWTLLEHARTRGIGDQVCHPDTLIVAGGGLKTASAPPDYLDQILRFYGIPAANWQSSYGMTEMIGSGPWSEKAQGYAICPWIVPLVLDKSGEVLLNPEDGNGTVEGRFAFFDLLAEGYWGGFITGDKVVVDFSPEGETDGLKGPLVRSVARYADLEEGEDKLTCAGTMESYVRGMVSA